MKYLFDVFSQRGTLCVSELHLKVGCPPPYRVDRRLQKTKSPPFDTKTVEALVAGLLSADNIGELKSY